METWKTAGKADAWSLYCSNRGQGDVPGTQDVPGAGTEQEMGVPRARR